jgi:hypothetical protein
MLRLLGDRYYRDRARRPGPGGEDSRHGSTAGKIRAMARIVAHDLPVEALRAGPGRAAPPNGDDLPVKPEPEEGPGHGSSESSESVALRLRVLSLSESESQAGH